VSATRSAANLRTARQRTKKSQVAKDKSALKLPRGFADEYGVTLEGWYQADGSVYIYWFEIDEPGMGRGETAWLAFERSLPAGTRIELTAYLEPVGFWRRMGFHTSGPPDPETGDQNMFKIVGSKASRSTKAWPA
jgi:hypothetical protein